MALHFKFCSIFFLWLILCTKFTTSQRPEIAPAPGSDASPSEPNDLPVVPSRPPSPPSIPSPSPFELTSPPPPSVALPEWNGPSYGLSGGKKAGIVIGTLAGAGLLWYFGMVYKKRQSNSNIRRARFGSAARRTALKVSSIDIRRQTAAYLLPLILTMAVPPVGQRSPEVYREAIVLSMEITILLGGALLFYTLLLILQEIYSYKGVILLAIGLIILLTLDHSSNSSLPITTAHKFMEISRQLGHIVVFITNKLREQPIQNNPDSVTKCSGIVAMWTSYVAYAGLLVQVFFRYPISSDTFFAGGLIVIALSANHTFLFSYMWDSMKKQSHHGQNIDQIDSGKKIDEDDLKEVKAKYHEDRQRWEEEKRDLTEQLLRAKAEASKLIEKTNAYSMFGNFNWD